MKLKQSGDVISAAHIFFQTYNSPAKSLRPWFRRSLLWSSPPRFVQTIWFTWLRLSAPCLWYL